MSKTAGALGRWGAGALGRWGNNVGAPSMFDQPCESYHRQRIAGKCPWCGEEAYQDYPRHFGVSDQAVLPGPSEQLALQQFYQAILPDLVASLTSPEVDRQLWALEGLEMVGEPAMPYVEPLLDLMDRCNKTLPAEKCGLTEIMRVNCLQALLSVAPGDERSHAALMPFLAHSQHRFEAIMLLIPLGEGAFFALGALLEIVTNTQMAETDLAIAARALGTIGPKAMVAEPALRRLLEHPSPTIRHFAATALQRIRSPE